jgi:phosphoserine phosphatase RsbU/P
MPKPRIQLTALVLAALASATYYTSSVIALMQEVYGDRVVRAPTLHGYQLNLVSGVNSEAEQAGIRQGDRVLAINGRPFSGYNVYIEELREGHAGDPFALTIQPHGSSPETPARTVNVRLAAANPSHPGFLRLISRVFFLSVFVPFGCLVLGIWVVAARPRDKNAWFLFWTLQYFIIIFGENQYWPGGLYGFISIWNTICMIAGPLSIMLFGIYFPERMRLDARFPWIKWILIVPLVALVPLMIGYDLGFAFSFQSIASFVSWVPALIHANTILAMIAIGIYFFCLGEKSSTASTPDVRRRLRILYAGSTIGNVPLFLLVLYSLVSGKDLGFGVPLWLFLGSLIIFTLFPISLAYVVVVHRAMDLRIIVRQGTQYALARSSLWILRIIAGALLAFALSRALNHHPIRRVDMVQVVALAALLIVVRMRTSKWVSGWIDRKFFREAYSAEQILNELAGQVQEFTETPALIRTVSECISNTLHIDRIAVLLRTGDTFRLQYAHGIPPGSDLALSGSSTTISNLDTVKTAASVYLDNPDAWLLTATDAERRALRELGAEILIPLRGRNRLLGVMALGPKRSEEPYSRTDRGLLQSVALHAGLSIENAELMQSLAIEAGNRARINREMEVAREVQERFLPQSSPGIAGVELAGAYRAALTVGGDYYDFIEMKEDSCVSLGIAIGDVSGKGISAALLMASLRASLRALTRKGNCDLAEVMSEVNSLIFEGSANNRYATFFFARLDPATRQLCYVNAGHNPPALIRRRSADDAEVFRLEAGGAVVGLLQHAEYEQSTLQLEPGDILMAFTDGISEAMKTDGEEWGEERLIEKLVSLPEMSSSDLAQRLFEAADKFADGAPQHDDMTLLVLKMLPAPAIA